MNLRCSSLPLIEKCPAAARAPSIKLVSGGDDARLGTAVHEALACHVRGWVPDLAEIAERREVEETKLEYLFNSGCRVWSQISVHFPEPKVEESLTWDILSGHPDVFTIVGNMARVFDFKSGFVDDSYRAQMLGYALLIFKLHPEVDEVWVGVGRLREQTIDGETITREQAEIWWDLLAENIKRESFNPNRWCGYCQRGHECEAKKNWLVMSHVVLRLTENISHDVTREVKIGRLFDAIKALEPFIERAKELVRAEVELLGGRVPLGDGRELAFREEERKTIDFLAAEPVLCEVLSAEAVARCVKVSKTALEHEIKLTAPYRGKGKAVKAVMDQLEAAGAITTEYQRKLEVRRVQSAITAETTATIEPQPAEATEPGR